MVIAKAKTLFQLKKTLLPKLTELPLFLVSKIKIKLDLHPVDVSVYHFPVAVSDTRNFLASIDLILDADLIFHASVCSLWQNC